MGWKIAKCGFTHVYSRQDIFGAMDGNYLFSYCYQILAVDTLRENIIDRECLTHDPVLDIDLRHLSYYMDTWYPLCSLSDARQLVIDDAKAMFRISYYEEHEDEDYFSGALVYHIEITDDTIQLSFNRDVVKVLLGLCDSVLD